MKKSLGWSGAPALKNQTGAQHPYPLRAGAVLPPDVYAHAKPDIDLITDSEAPVSATEQHVAEHTHAAYEAAESVVVNVAAQEKQEPALQSKAVQKRRPLRRAGRPGSGSR